MDVSQKLPHVSASLTHHHLCGTRKVQSAQIRHQLDSKEPFKDEENDSCPLQIDLSAERWVNKQQQDIQRIRALQTPEENTLSKVERKLLKKKIKEPDATPLQQTGKSLPVSNSHFITACQVKESNKQEKKPDKVEDRDIILQNPQLLSFFLKYPQFTINNRIIYPIPDNFFAIQPLKSLVPRTLKSISPRLLPNHFSLQLQVYNWFIQNPNYFELPSDFTQSLLPHYLLTSGPLFNRIFWKMHQFCLKSTSQSNNELSYVWMFAFQADFAQQLFTRNWKFFMSRYLNQPQLNSARFDSLRTIMHQSSKPTYIQLLKYIIALISLNLDTKQYRILLTEKITNKRDVSKALQQAQYKKRYVDRTLKSTVHQLDKQRILLHSIKLKIDDLIKEKIPVELGLHAAKQSQKVTCQQKIKVLELKRNELLLERDHYNSKVQELPENDHQMSTVQFIGFDGLQNLYWVVRDRPSRLYCENSETGQWGAIQGSEIMQFISELNVLGIKDSKLRRNILSYLKLGHLQTDGEKVEDVKEGITGETVAQSIVDCLKSPTIASVFKIVHQIDELMTYHLKYRETNWETLSFRISFLARFQKATSITLLAANLITFNNKICIVEANIHGHIRKIQTKLWGFHEKAKQEWTQLAQRANSIDEIHFLADTLLQIVRKYVSKQRPNTTKYTQFFKTASQEDSPSKLLSSSEPPQEIIQLNPSPPQLRSKSKTILHDDLS